MNYRLFFSAILLLSLLFATDSKAKNINETALEILRNSPDFKSENLELKTLESALKIDNNLPDPQLDGEYLVAPGDESNRWATALSWGIDWPGVYSAKGKEAKKKLSAAEVALHNRRTERLYEIKTLLIDYILCKQKLLLLDELTNNNDSIYRLSKKAAEKEELSVLDLNKIRLEYANIKGAKATVMSEEASIISDLASLAGKDCSEVLRELESEFPPVYLPSEEMLNEGLKTAPTVKLAKSEVEAARQSKKVARMEALPSLSIGYKHAYEDGIHFNGGLLGISIPIFSSRGKQKAADASILEAEFKVDAATQSVENRVQQSLSKLRLLKQQIDEIEPILNSSNHNAILLKAYKSGLITMVDYLTERNYFINAAMEFLSLKHSAAMAQIELSKSLETVDF